MLTFPSTVPAFGRVTAFIIVTLRNLFVTPNRLSPLALLSMDYYCRGCAELHQGAK